MPIMQDINDTAAEWLRSDKGVNKNYTHSYLEFYSMMFEHLRHQPINILEIGISKGGSMLIWDKYFDNAETKIYGIDKKYYSGWGAYLTSPRITTIVCDATTLDPEKLKLPKFNIIIDDASHKVRHQSAVFKLLWPLVLPSGYYIIEDNDPHENGDESIKQLLDLHNFEVHDFRKASGRWDDVLLISKKPALGIPGTARVQ